MLSERVLEHTLFGGTWFFVPEDQTFFVCPSYDVPSASLLRLRRIDPESLTEDARSGTTHDAIRALDRRPQDGLLACCGYGKVFILGPDALELRAKVGGLGGALGCLAFDAAGDHLVVGSNWREYIKVVDAHTWELAGRNHAGRVTGIARTRSPHEVVLLHGPTGRVAWFDCAAGRVTHRASVPPFEGVAGDATRLFLATGDPEPSVYAPITYANPLVPTGRAGQVLGYAPVPGTERVRTAKGVAVVDLADRSLLAHVPTPAYGDFPWAMLQASESNDRLFLLSPGRVRSMGSDDLEIEWEWGLPEAPVPLAVLGEGTRAVVARDRDVLRRLALVEQVESETLTAATVVRLLGVYGK